MEEVAVAAADATTAPGKVQYRGAAENPTLFQHNVQRLLYLFSGHVMLYVGAVGTQDCTVIPGLYVYVQVKGRMRVWKTLMLMLTQFVQLVSRKH